MVQPRLPWGIGLHFPKGDRLFDGWQAKRSCTRKKNEVNVETSASLVGKGGKTGRNKDAFSRTVYTVLEGKASTRDGSWSLTGDQREKISLKKK